MSLTEDLLPPGWDEDEPGSPIVPGSRCCPRKERCPYCGEWCECDVVDVEVGYAQCGPYHCEACGASEIGPEWDRVKDTLTERERETWWYEPGKPVSPYANTVGGVLVDHKTAKEAYELGLLDPKPFSEGCIQ